jgi:hypothetical protein
LNLARASRELGRILEPFDLAAAARVDQPQLEAAASVVMANLVENAVR